MLILEINIAIVPHLHPSLEIGFNSGGWIRQPHALHGHLHADQIPLLIEKGRSGFVLGRNEFA